MNNLQIAIINQVCGMTELTEDEKNSKNRFYLGSTAVENGFRYFLTQQVIDGEDFIKVWSEQMEKYENLDTTTIGFVPIPRPWEYGDLANKIEMLIEA